MTTLLRELLEISLFPSDQTPGLILVAGSSSNEDQDGTTGAYAPPSRDLFPGTCDVQVLPSGEGFLDAMLSLLHARSVSRLLILPPFVAARHLSVEWRQQYPRQDLHAAVVQLAAQALQPGAILGAVLPTSFFSTLSTRDARKHLFERLVPRLVVTHESALDLGFSVPPVFRLSTLIAEVGSGRPTTIRFFKCPVIDSSARQGEVMADLQRLLKQGGGTTTHGYVLRDIPAVDAVLLHDKYHPSLVQRREEIAQLGTIRPLGELVSILPGLPLAHNAHVIRADDSTVEGVRVIEGRDIRPDGTIAPIETRFRAAGTPQHYLQEGDICLRAIVGPADRLIAAQVDAEMLPLVHAHSIVALRPKAELTDQDRAFLLAYLRSPRALEYLRSHGLGVSLMAEQLRQLPVPILDATLKTVVDDLGMTARQFRRWADEADEAQSTLFSMSSVKETRMRLLSTGRLARQRYEAAVLANDFRHRIRTQFPHPIAFRWRTVETACPDLEGYLQVLECAEVALSYLAMMAMLLARAAEKTIAYAREMGTRIRSGKGTTMGDWAAIVREVCTAKQFRALGDDAPFYEMTQVEVGKDSPTQRLVDRRNDQAHGRGPKGAESVHRNFQAAIADLESLLHAVEFLTEYPLYFVERTTIDSLQGINHYEYRQLMGDHPLTPLNQAQTRVLALEAGSLYLMDRTKSLHLLRPLLTRRQCPTCGIWSTYYLDKYERQSNSCLLKAMEHGHDAESTVVGDARLVQALQSVGLLGE